VGLTPCQDVDWVNVRGYHENVVLSKFFNSVLEAGNSSWSDDPMRLLVTASGDGGGSGNDGPSLPPMDALVARFHGVLVALLRKEMAGTETFLVKDPRAVHCWPLLVGALQELGYGGRGSDSGFQKSVALVANYRPCEEVAASFAKAQGATKVQPPVTYLGALAQCRAYGSLIAHICHSSSSSSSSSSSIHRTSRGVAGPTKAAARLLQEMGAGAARGDGPRAASLPVLPDHPWPCFAHEYHSLVGSEDSAARQLADLWRFAGSAQAPTSSPEANPPQQWQSIDGAPEEGQQQALAAARGGARRCVSPSMRHEGRPKRTVAYVIATYGGSGRHFRGAFDPIHPRMYLRLHLRHLASVPTTTPGILGAVLIVRPPVDAGQSELEGFYDVAGDVAVLEQAKPGLEVLWVHPKENEGSYSQLLFAFEETRGSYDFYLWCEDDYVACMPHFDQLLVDWYTTVAFPRSAGVGAVTAPSGAGAAILQGYPHEPQSPFGEHPESAMFFSASALLDLYQDPKSGAGYPEPPRAFLRSHGSVLLAHHGASLNHWYFNAHQQAAGVLFGQRFQTPMVAWSSHFRSPTFGEGPLGVGVYDYASGKSPRFQLQTPMARALVVPLEAVNATDAFVCCGANGFDSCWPSTSCVVTNYGQPNAMSCCEYGDLKDGEQAGMVSSPTEDPSSFRSMCGPLLSTFDFEAPGAALTVALSCGPHALEAPLPGLQEVGSWAMLQALLRPQFLEACSGGWDSLELGGQAPARV
jgi:hypothetical protein